MLSVVEHVPSFVTSKTKQGLVRKMLKINLRDQFSYRFFDIQYVAAEKQWVAWYYPEKSKIKKAAE